VVLEVNCRVRDVDRVVVGADLALYLAAFRSRISGSGLTSLVFHISRSAPRPCDVWTPLNVLYD